MTFDTHDTVSETHDAAGSAAAVPPNGGVAGSGRPAPWPADHVPATDGEARAWWAFDRLRADPHGPMSQIAVANEGAMSRTPISQKVKGFVLLRRHIRDEVKRRKSLRDGLRGKPAKPSAAERAAAREATRGDKIDYWKAVAQQADSAVLLAVARAVRAENASRDALAMLTRVLADFKAGRWVQADPGAVVLGEIEAFLSFKSAAARTGG